MLKTGGLSTPFSLLISIMLLVSSRCDYRVLSPYTPGQILFGNKAFIVCCGHFNVEKWAILRKCITLQSAFELEKFLGFVYISGML